MRPGPLRWDVLRRLSVAARADPRDYALFNLMLYAGLRSSQIVAPPARVTRTKALQVVDFDPRRATLRVEGKILELGQGATWEALVSYVLSMGQRSTFGREPSEEVRRAHLLFPITTRALYARVRRWGEVGRLLDNIPYLNPMTLIWTHRDYMKGREGARCRSIFEKEILIQVRAGASGERFVPYLALLDGERNEQRANA